MACVNTAHPDFKLLEREFGTSIAEGLTIQNGYKFPTVDQARNLLTANKAKQFQAGLKNIQNLSVPNPDNLISGLGKVIQQFAASFFITKGARLADNPTPSTKKLVEGRNLGFVKFINEKVGKIFNISRHFNDSTISNLREDILKAIRTTDMPGYMNNTYKEFANDATKHEDLFDSLVSQASNSNSLSGLLDAVGPEITDKILNYADTLRGMESKGSVDMLHKAMGVEGTRSQEMKELDKKMIEIGTRMTADKSRTKMNPVEFAKEIFPQEYIDRYKNLWEMASRVGIDINVGFGNVGYGAQAAYFHGMIQLDPMKGMRNFDNLDQFAEALNHEIIHGLLDHGVSFSNNASFKLHTQLKTIFEAANAHFDDASDEVKEILSYINDTSKEYQPQMDFDNLQEDPEKTTTIGNYEELVTYAFTNPEFVKFLDTIPSTGKAKQGSKTIWGELKQIIRDFLKSWVSPSLMDDINTLMDEHFDSNFRETDMANRREQFSDLPAWQKPVRFMKAKVGSQLFSDPNPGTVALETKYQEDKGLPVSVGTPITKLNTDNSIRIADAYAEMKHDPSDPEVKASYEAMAKETLDQFKYIQDAGYKVELYEGKGEPYANSAAMIADVVKNKHQYVLSTEGDFGSTAITDQQRKDNPLLRNSGFTDVNGKPLLVNDVFRYVHDFFGHTLRGNSFGPVGEENAWDVHSRMYTPLARRAMTTETRGQNSWVNFGLHMRNEDGSIKKKGDEGFLSATERPFADQKIGLLPEEFSTPLGEGINNISGNEPVQTGTSLPTRLEGDNLTGAVDESLSSARESNKGVASAYVTTAAAFADGHIEGPASMPNTVTIPYSNSKLARELRNTKKDILNADKSKSGQAQKLRLITKAFKLADQVYAEVKEAMKANIKGLYDAWDKRLIDRSRHWYDGANRVAQKLAGSYNMSLDATAGIMAVLSPQNEWFNNISGAHRVLNILTNHADDIITDDMFKAASDKVSGEPFDIVIGGIRNQYAGMSMNELMKVEDSPEIIASFLRIIDLNLHTRKVAIVSPEGVIDGIKQSDDGDASFAWGSSGEIYKAISIFKDPSIENISRRLGKGNKVRNFYNNIANPNSTNGEVTVDTHALAAALLNVVSANDASSMGLFRNDSKGNSPIYATVKEAYQEVAKEKGLLPREMQSIVWEGMRLLIKQGDKTKDNQNFINSIWQQVQSKTITQDEAIKQIIGRFQFDKPQWDRSTDKGSDRTSVSKVEYSLYEGERNGTDLRGQQTTPGQSSSNMVGRDVKEGFVDAINKKAIDQWGKPYLPSIDNPQISALVPSQIGFFKDDECKPGRCETNAFLVSKKYPDRFYPVGGYFITSNDFPVEHWWVYDRQTNQHMEVTIDPSTFEAEGIPADYIKGYFGMVNTELQDDIKQANIVWDVDFFKGGNVQRQYFDPMIAQEETAKADEHPGFKTVTDKDYFQKAVASPVEEAIRKDKRMFNNLTEDDNGNYVFFHHSGSDLSKKGIDPKKFGKNVNKTSREEASRTVPVSMYYTDAEVGETGLGGHTHVVRISKDKVYPFNSDPLHLIDEAEERFKEKYPDRAFTPNEQIGWVGKVAAEHGFQMVVAYWDNGSQKTLRAESTQLLKPELVSQPKTGGFYSPGTVEYLTTEDFKTNKSKYGGKSRYQVADGTYKVDVNQEELNKVVDNNTAEQTKVEVADATNIGEKTEEEQKVREVKKNFILDHIMDFLKSKFNLPFDVINDPEQKFKGRFSGGRITLNMAYISGDTAFHEVAHPIVELIKQSNKELYNNLVNQINNTKQGQRELERVQKEYADSTPEEQMDEAIVSLIGRMSEQAYANTISAEDKTFFQKVLSFFKSVLNELGFYTPDFRTNMSIADVADLLVNPLFKYDFQANQRRVAMAEQYDQKASANTAKFDDLVDTILNKLKIDSKIPGKTEDEKIRKFVSGRIATDIEANRRDLKALNAFTDAALFNMLDLNKKFDKFKDAYANKKNKTRQDINELSSLLGQIEDHLALYNDTASLISVIKSEFPADAEFIKDEFGYSLERERLLTEDYKDWAAEAVADFLVPYMNKTINNALNGGDLFSVVPEEIFNKEKDRLAREGVTDKRTIINAAAKQYIKNSLLTASQDSSMVTSMLAGVLNSKDSISQLVGLAVTDELTKALQIGQKVFHRLSTLSTAKFGNWKKLFTTNEDFKKAYQPYLRKAKVWTYVGMNKDGSKNYEYREHEAFHEEYKWDEFYNKKREDFEKLGPRPSKIDAVKFKAWNDAKEAWFTANTVTVKTPAGKDARVPNSTYRNAEFTRLMASDPFFKEMYNAYKDANNRLEGSALKYGIVPQKKTSTIAGKVKDLKKTSGKGVLQGLRDWIGEEEQVYYAQKIDGTQGNTVKSYFTHLLDPGDELDYNILSSVAKFASASYRYQAMSQIEPEAKILKNFIGGNNILNMKQRQAYKKTSSGISSLFKGEHMMMPVDAKKLNAQLNSYINDAFYGETMETEVKKLWGAQFKVWKTGDVSNNGGPQMTTIDGFENLMKHTDLPNLDYQGFNWMQDREAGQYTIRMVQKDWNFSIKKTANRLGLLTALNTLVINPTAAAVNILRGKIETYVEATGGKFFKMKDALKGDAEYFKALGSGDFFEDLHRDKPSFLSSMAIQYDAIQGELIDINGKNIEPGVANRLFRRNHLFFLMNAGEHLIQIPLMISVMNNQKVTLTDGTTMSLYDARKAEYAGTLNWSKVQWTEEQDRQFRETLKFVNTSLNGNYDKTDKAMFQRKWYGSMFLMYKKHIYNLLANRYRSGFVHLESGRWTEGYYRTFMTGVVNQLKDVALNHRLQSTFTTEQSYAFRKIMADIGVVALLITAFKMFDDDDDKDSLSDEAALISRRLISESGQYSPFLIGSEMARIVKNPFASTNTVESYIKAIQQTISDPNEVYERSGSGYKEGQNKAAVMWGRALPGLKVIRNMQEPERLLEFYKTNSVDFLKPNAGKDGQDDITDEK